MLFSSITFLYYFLPIVLLLYLIVPKILKNAVLLCASLIFYGWGEPKYIVLMVFAILSSYILGLLIDKFRATMLSKIFVTMSIVSSLGILAYFKYADFFISNFNTVIGLDVPLLKLALPIGISFYTFQTLSYTIDLYWGNVPVQKNLISFATYVVLFPQLIAGPIVRYIDIDKQLEDRTHSLEKVALGIRRFTLGLGKKILIANQLGELCEIFRAMETKTVLFYWLYAVAFMLHIYFDFSGYSDMAIGLGKIFGFDFMENFNYPYISASVTEFWRRWHISLSTWFRDYLYIPLGGNRVSNAKRLRNIFIVWLATGFWHGAAWNFIIWGLYFAVILLIEKHWLLEQLNKCKVINHIYVLFLVAISFVIFNAADMSEAFVYIGGMFGIGADGFVDAEWFYYIRSYGLILLLGIVGATPLPKLIMSKIEANPYGKKCLSVLEPIALAFMMLIMTAYLVDGSFNPFLYFRF